MTTLPPANRTTRFYLWAIHPERETRFKTLNNDKPLTEEEANAMRDRFLQGRAAQRIVPRPESYRPRGPVIRETWSSITYSLKKVSP